MSERGLQMIEDLQEELDAWKARAEAAEREASLTAGRLAEATGDFWDTQVAKLAEVADLRAKLALSEAQANFQAACVQSVGTQRDEAIARAERAEAAAGKMRAALEPMTRGNGTDGRKVRTQCCGGYYPDKGHDCDVMRALATDAGKGWVSPEAHAEALASARDFMNRYWDSIAQRVRFGASDLVELIDSATVRERQAMDKLIKGAHLVVTRGHQTRCTSLDTAFTPRTACDCGFDQLREALKEVAP